jgi:hypothetical protein
MEVIPSPFSLAQLTATKHSWCNHGNQGMLFTVEQKGPKGTAGLKYKGSMKYKTSKIK